MGARVAPAWTRSGRPSEQPRQGRGVHPEVEQGSPADRGVEQAMRRPVVEDVRQVGPHRTKLADLTGGDDLRQPPDGRVEPGPHALQAEQAALGRRVRDLATLPSVEGERLLDQHRLAGVQGEERRVPVLRVRGRDVHDVDPGVRDELVVGAVRGRCTQAVGQRPGPAQVTRGDRVNRAAPGGGDVRADRGRDTPGAEDAPADLPTHLASLPGKSNFRWNFPAATIGTVMLGVNRRLTCAQGVLR